MILQFSQRRQTADGVGQGQRTAAAERKGKQGEMGLREETERDTGIRRNGQG